MTFQYRNPKTMKAFNKITWPTERQESSVGCGSITLKAAAKRSHATSEYSRLTQRSVDKSRKPFKPIFLYKRRGVRTIIDALTVKIQLQQEHLNNRAQFTHRKSIWGKGNKILKASLETGGCVRKAAAGSDDGDGWTELTVRYSSCTLERTSC